MLVLVSIFFIAFGSTLSAQEKDPFGITMYGSFLHTEQVPDALFFFNDIEQYDSFEFRRALRNHNVDTVVLGSNGGNVFEALNMAAIINDNEISTYVPKLPDEMGCYSACAYMFFGGQHRRADGVLAVHQAGSYEPEFDQSKQKVGQTQQQTQFTVSEIIGFLNEFDTPAFVYEKMFRSRDFYVFNENEIKTFSSGSDELNHTRIEPINRFIEDFLRYFDTISKNTHENKTELIVDLTQGEIEDTTDDRLGPNEDKELTLNVVDIQIMLNLAGCDAGIADGIWGKRTQDAAILFANTAKIKLPDTELLSDVFIDALKAAPVNFCPKKNIIKREKSATLIAQYWHAKYYFSCSLARGMSGEMVMDLNSKENLLKWTIYYSSGSKFRGSITNPTTETVQIRFGKYPETLQLKRSKDGKKINSFSYRWSGNGKCTGTAS